MEIEIKQGKVVLKEPTAGARNKALMTAETPEGIKNTVLMVELLPYCVQSHPFGTVPIKQALDALSVKDYDELVKGLTKLMNPKGDLEKKSEGSSEGQDLQADGSTKS